MFKTSISISAPIQFILVALILLALISSNPVLTVLALLFPPVAAKLVWKKNEPPILFLGLMLQWLQITIKVFYADVFNVSFESVNFFAQHINESFVLCLAALFIECIGIHIVVRRYLCSPISSLKLLTNNYNLAKLTSLYIMFSLLAPIAVQYGPGNAGLQQFIIKFADFKWSIFFIFYCVTFLRAEKTLNFYLILSVEIIIGFAGYFSGFKDFFLFAAICYLTIKERMSLGQYISVIIVALVLFNIMILWQTVKNDYRAYLSGSRRAQIVTVSTSQALNVLYYRITAVGTTAYRDGMRHLVDRISYVDFFSAVKGYVPTNLPHENGKLWTEAVVRIFTPRILFPNKAFIDDSERSAKYTGRTFAGSADGTSVSLGYITESYIDFGPIYMFVPLFFFGMMIGWIYTFIITRTYNQMLGYACSVPLFFQIYTFELALNKAMGALFAYFLVYLLVRKYVVRPAERFFLNNPHPVSDNHEYSPGQRLV